MYAAGRHVDFARAERNDRSPTPERWWPAGRIGMKNTHTYDITLYVKYLWS